jgi:hypothetical protein
MKEAKCKVRLDDLRSRCSMWQLERRYGCAREVLTKYEEQLIAQVVTYLRVTKPSPARTQEELQARLDFEREQNTNYRELIDGIAVADPRNLLAWEFGEQLRQRAKAVILEQYESRCETSSHLGWAVTAAFGATAFSKIVAAAAASASAQSVVGAVRVEVHGEHSGVESDAPRDEVAVVGETSTRASG